MILDKEVYLYKNEYNQIKPEYVSSNIQPTSTAV